MAEPDTTTRVVRPPDFEQVELAERIALFAMINRHPRASKVLEGMVKPAAEAGTKLLAIAMTWPSGKRQGRATLEFGNRPDQHERLSRLVSEAPPALKLAMCAQMSPQQQARFPQFVNKEFRQIPGRNALAARLVREATR